MNLFDTTIRDGSYAVDFKFSCADVEKILSKLQKLGFKYIEIGHGLGLNASSEKYGYSLHTDTEYMQTAKNVLTTSKFGFFCIPHIARIEDLHIAKDNGVSFVRIGVSVTKPEEAKKYIKEAKKLNLTVMTNFMKSYIVSPQKYTENAQLVEDYGTDVVYIVDSAGCMLPDELEDYYNLIRAKTMIPLGFHGHNNLGMAVANSVKCVQLGFDYVDCTLQGLGRSIGNASTEQLVMTLEKMGFSLNIDIPRLLEYGYSLIKDVSDRKLYHPLDLVCGYAGFHSAFLKDIYKCCCEKEVDPMRLIIAYSKINKETVNYTELCTVADSLDKDADINPYSFRNFFSVIFNDNIQ